MTLALTIKLNLDILSNPLTDAEFDNLCGGDPHIKSMNGLVVP